MRQKVSAHRRPCVSLAQSALLGELGIGGGGHDVGVMGSPTRAIGELELAGGLQVGPQVLW